MYKCSHCEVEYGSICGGKQHEAFCHKNPGRRERKAWNRGLDKSDERVRLRAEATSRSTKGRPGRPTSEATKKKISLSRKKFLEDNPDKVPYLMNHSSKISYP